jgi:hypothetical protein
MALHRIIEIARIRREVAARLRVGDVDIVLDGVDANGGVDVEVGNMGAERVGGGSRNNGYT